MSQSARSKNSKRTTDNSELLSEMSDLSDIPTLSDLAESEIGEKLLYRLIFKTLNSDEDMRTVKELMGATNPLDTQLADIRLSTDDEGPSELKLTDVEVFSDAVIKFNYDTLLYIKILKITF